MWTLFLGVALASPPQPVEGECSRHIPIRKGLAVPHVLASAGVAKCSAVAVPLSELAGYLQLAGRLLEADKLHTLDVSILQQERDYYRTALEREQDRKWYETPAAHRWAGRLDILLVAVALTGTVSAVYQVQK